jgi:3-phosphoshikimate 1-carboxyvinyltransferase
MGARLTIEPDPDEGPEPTGSVTVEAGPLLATEIGGEEVPRLIDEVPVLAVAAARAQGVTRFRGVQELRVKESDRIGAIVEMLRRLGAQVEESPDGFSVSGPVEFAPCRIATRGDHRIAMSALVAGAAAEGEVEIDAPEMIATSDPGFLERLRALQGAPAAGGR